MAVSGGEVLRLRQAQAHRARERAGRPPRASRAPRLAETPGRLLGEEVPRGLLQLSAGARLAHPGPDRYGLRPLGGAQVPASGVGRRKEGRMTLIAVVYGDWRPSFGGARAHYGHGPVALCGSRRNFTDSRIPRDK